MNLNNMTTNDTIEAAVGRLEGWLATMGGPDGYYGPVVGLRGVSMAWCGIGHDWRWEGLLDGWTTLHRRTQDAVYLERMDAALNALKSAQLANGTFCNSYFENNPFEGGMPYEPALMAAVVRTLQYMKEIAHPWPDGTAEMVERFVEQRLIKELWNKVLKTFNNWMQSDFERYSPPAVAAIVETLYGYAKLTASSERLAPYLEGAANSLLASQFRDGSRAGALPLSNQEGSDVSPCMAARALPAFALMQQHTGDVRFAAAGDALACFVSNSLLPDGGISYMAYARRPPRTAPLFVGATADTLRSLERAGRVDAAVMRTQLTWLLSHQTASGAFDTAVGFDDGRGGRRQPDWRDVIPVCGWADKVYGLLAGLVEKPVSIVSGGQVCRNVRVRGEEAVFMEDNESMTLRSKKTEWFVWRKRTVCPSACRL
jgi:hypothetical protein